MPHSRRPLSIHVISPTTPLRPQWLGEAPDMTRLFAIQELPLITSLATGTPESPVPPETYDVH